MSMSPGREPEAALVLLRDKSQKIRVRITNQSAETWPAVGHERVEVLLSWICSDGAEIASYAAATPLAGDLEPGSSQTLCFTATPPATLLAHLRVRRRRSQARGQPPRVVSDYPVVVVAAEDYAHGSLTVAEPIPALPAGAAVVIPVVLHNASAFDWEARPPARLNLWGHIGADKFATPLVEDIASGGSSEIRLSMTTPVEPGRYKLRFNLMRPSTISFREMDSFDAPSVDLEIVSPHLVTLDPRFRRETSRILLECPPHRPVGVAGSPLAVTIALLNDGPGAVDFAALEWNWSHGSEPGPTHRFDLKGSLSPGARRRVDMLLEAPSPGMHTAQFRIVSRLGEREGDPVAIGELAVEVVEPESVMKLEGEILSASPVLLCDEQQIVAFQITNVAEHPVSAQASRPLAVLQRWSLLDGKRAPQLRGRRNVQISLPPGACEVLSLPLSPPADAGDYRVEFEAHRHNAPSDDKAVEFSAPAIECKVVRMRDLAFPAEKSLRKALAAASGAAERLAYSHWASQRDSLSDADRDDLAGHVARWPHRPLVCVLIPLSARTLPLVATTVRSLKAQIYQNWELCIGLDAELTPLELREFLGEVLDDRRVRLSHAPRGADAAGLWRAAAQMARGDFCQLVSPGDALAAHGMVFFCGEVVRDVRVTVLYSDRDELDGDGARHSPTQLPGADPDLMVALDYMGRSLFVKTQVLREALPDESSSNAAWYHEVVLRILETQPLDLIRHIPNIVYHCGAGVDDGPTQWRAGERTVNAHLARVGMTAHASRVQGTQGYRLRLEPPNPSPRVSIIIPTRDGLEFLTACISSILGRTLYKNYEIIVMDNGSVRDDMLQYLAWLNANSIAKVVRDDGDFNWSRLNNRGASEASGEIYCLLNDDTEVINESWLCELVSHAVRPDVGAVGALLWYPNGTLQHGGVGFDFRSARPYLTSRTADRARVRDIMPVARSCGAVTGACLVTRKEVFEAAGRMDEIHFPIGYNDIDYCMKVREDLGLRCVWTPFAELLHKESASRGTPRTEEDRNCNFREASIFVGRWRDAPLRDPYFRPGFDSAPEVTPRVRPGATAMTRRYRLPRLAPIAFVHMPGTAGAAVFDLLQREGGGLTVNPLSARALLGCHDGDAAVLAGLNRWLGDVDVLVAHLSFGFGAMIGWDCAYATILRDPIERTISQYRRLLNDPASPFWDSGMLDAPIGLLLRKGVLRGNLQLHKILGRPPERASWSDIDGVGSVFAGFDLPVEVWRGQFDGLLDQSDVAPEDDMALVDQAMAIIESHFAFVGRREDFDSHMAAFMRALGLDDAPRADQMNVSPASQSAPAAEDLSALEAFNRLDRALYDRIAAMPGGMVINEALLTGVTDGDRVLSGGRTRQPTQKRIVAH